MTASTANSGSACSQARIASAIPCDTRNWAHSAPQEIRKAETTTAGKGQAFAQKPAGPAGAVPGTKAATSPRARLGILRRGPSQWRAGAGDCVVGSLMGGVVYHALPRARGARGGTQAA